MAAVALFLCLLSLSFRGDLLSAAGCIEAVLVGLLIGLGFLWEFRPFYYLFLLWSH